MAEDKQGHYLTGKLLLAMPSMTDIRFERAVIFICGHDQNGAMGLMINDTLTGIRIEQLLEQLGLTSDINVDRSALEMPVMNGGPVDTGRGFLLHGADFNQKDTIRVDDEFGVTGTVEALKDIASGKAPDEMLFILGYAGWDAGQLEDEITRNSWLVVDPDPALIFQAEAGDKWQQAIQKLGFDPAMLSNEGGRA